MLHLLGAPTTSFAVGDADTKDPVGWLSRIQTEGTDESRNGSEIRAILGGDPRKRMMLRSYDAR